MDRVFYRKINFMLRDSHGNTYYKGRHVCPCICRNKSASMVYGNRKQVIGIVPVSAAEMSTELSENEFSRDELFSDDIIRVLSRD
jgi:hypothetical protein